MSWNKTHLTGLSTGSTTYHKFYNSKLYILAGDILRVFNNLNSDIDINRKTFIDDCLYNPEKVGQCIDIEILPEVFELWQDKILDEIMEIYQKN